VAHASIVALVVVVVLGPEVAPWRFFLFGGRIVLLRAAPSL
jgi:hypothetical protein